MKQEKMCKYCKKMMPSNSNVCPNCNCKQKLPVWVIIVIVLVALVVIGMIFGSSDEPTSNDGTNSGNSSNEVENNNNNNSTSNKKEFSQSETVTYKGVDYSITKVEKSNGTTFDQPKEGHEYVIVYIKIVNNSGKKISYNEYDWKMSNSLGQEDNTAFTIVDTDTSLSSGDLIAGGVKEGTLVFEQPVNDNDLRLNYYYNILSDNYTFQFKLN